MKPPPSGMWHTRIHAALPTRYLIELFFSMAICLRTARYGEDDRKPVTRAAYSPHHVGTTALAPRRCLIAARKSGGPAITFRYFVSMCLLAIPIVSSQRGSPAMEPYVPSM